MSEIIIEAQNLAKSFSRRQTQQQAHQRDRLQILKGIDLSIEQGDAVCILGASGAGKSTLLNILGTLDKPDSGHLIYKTKNLLSMSDDQLSHFRNREMGFVFQFHHLLSEFSALENVMLPAQIQPLPGVNIKQRALELLDFLGLKDRAAHYPSEMSGGERQRVAIARALVQKPSVLFADEPTGNLDTQNSRMIEDYLFKLHDELGLTLVVVTHDEEFARKFSRQMVMVDGIF